MQEEARPFLAPIVSIDHDRERYMVQIELPGVKRDDIELEVSDGSFCIHAERDDAVMTGCYFLAHQIDIDAVMAAFDGTWLNVQMPLRSPIRGKMVEVREGTLDFGQKDPRRMEIREGRGSLGIGTH
jgi:HSP20 family protein